MALKKDEDIVRFMETGLDIKNRIIVVCAASKSNDEEPEINAHHSEQLIKGLIVLENADNKAPITLMLNTPGGLFFQGLAMFDAIKTTTCKVNIKVIGQCMSMGAIVLQAGDKRLLHPNATLMLHEGIDGFYGHPRDFERWAEWSKKSRRKMYEIFAERTGRPVSYWRRKLERDLILTAEDAIREGLADAIIPHAKK